MSATKNNKRKPRKKTAPLRFDVALYLACLKAAILVLTGLDLNVIETKRAYALSNHFGSFALVVHNEDGLKCLECPHDLGCTHICAVTLYERRIPSVLEANS